MRARHVCRKEKKKRGEGEQKKRNKMTKLQQKGEREKCRQGIHTRATRKRAGQTSFVAPGTLRVVRLPTMIWATCVIKRESVCVFA